MSWLLTKCQSIYLLVCFSNFSLQLLTPSVLINRLIKAHKHLLALRLSEYLGLSQVSYQLLVMQQCIFFYKKQNLWVERNKRTTRIKKCSLKKLCANLQRNHYNLMLVQEVVIMHWACTKITASAVIPDATLLQILLDKVSFSVVYVLVVSPQEHDHKNLVTDPKFHDQFYLP